MKRFDWKKTTGYRPVFTADYFPGVPSVYKYGQKDISSDLEHIKGYLDPVTSRTLNFAYKCSYLAYYDSQDARDKGWAAIPDITGMSEEEVGKWQEQVRSDLEPYLKMYNRHGIQCMGIYELFLCHGFDTSPEWYHKVPDWDEYTVSGERLSEKDIKYVTACLFHPEMYRIIDKTFETLAFLSKDRSFLGMHIDNEPNLSLGRDISDYGGNPYTVSAFREYLAGIYMDISEFDSIAGTKYDSFESINTSDANWLVRTLLSRFRGTFISGVYLARAAALARKYFPKAVLVTRLQTGYFLKEWENGHDINGMDLTYLKDSEYDVIAWCNQWDTKVRDGMGQLNVTGGLLRGTGKMLGFSETFMQRFGVMHYSSYRPLELMHYVYRGLLYDLRMYNFHSWDRKGEWVHDEPMGLSYLARPATLKITGQIRMEMDRIRPFETFGKPLTAPIVIIVSRNARNFPGSNGWFYGNLLYKLCQVFEKPMFSCYEVAEECTSDLKEILKHVKGAVVVDACLSARTRDLLGGFAAGGGKVLVFGAPSIVGAKYEHQDLPGNYPVYAEHTDLKKYSMDREYSVTGCRKTSSHPVFKGIGHMDLLQPVPIRLKPGAVMLAVDGSGHPAAAAKGNIVYCSGIAAPGNEPAVRFRDHHQIYGYSVLPGKKDLFERILSNFASWCGVETPDVILSRFENATVVQNWDTANHGIDGKPLDYAPWTGHVDLMDTASGGIFEIRGDQPWLAYHNEGDRTVIEGVMVEQQDIKIFRREQTNGSIHLENIPDSIGFSSWWSGNLHPVTGRFRAVRKSFVEADISGGDEGELSWFVAEVGGERTAEGDGRKVRFGALPGKEYYLTVLLTRHKGNIDCPLCRRNMFE
jgi:hypothetical protein